MQTAQQPAERSPMPLSAVEAPLQLVRVPRHVVAQLWHEVEGKLESVVERSGGAYSLAAIRDECEAGRMTLWLAGGTRADGTVYFPALMGSEVAKSIAGKTIAKVVFMTGIDRARWMHLLGEFERAMKAEGCTRVEIWARKGWQRELPDYKLTHVMLEKDI